MIERETYSIVMAGLKRELRLFEVAPGLRIALLNILGDTELVKACASALIEKTKDIDYDIILTAETKSIPLAYEFSAQTKKPYVVLRKSYKFYMGEAIKAETLSITTGAPQTLFLDEKDHELINGKKFWWWMMSSARGQPWTECARLWLRPKPASPARLPF